MANLSLLDDAKKLDQRALIAIFDRYAADIYNYALWLRSDSLEANNVVGDVFSKFLEQLADGKELQMDLRSHLYKLAYHFTVNGARFSKREAALEYAELELSSGNGRYSVSSNPENEISMETLVLAINKHLTSEQRHVIVLHFVEGFSLLETAEIVGKEVSKVKGIQSRAIAKLCRVMDHTVSA